MIVFSDLHAKEDNEITVFDLVLPALVKAAAEDPDKLLIFLGDFWHVRYTINVHLQNRAKKFIEQVKDAECQLLMLPGNHDQINVEGENALEIFTHYDHVEVFTKAVWNELGLWLPYRKDIKMYGMGLSTVKPNESFADVLWTHIDIQGGLMNTSLVNKDGMAIENFTRFEKVISGHYHQLQHIGHITYVGSPFQTKADERGQEKGYLKIDMQKQTMEFVAVENTPQYQYIEISEAGALPTDLNLQAQDMINITVESAQDIPKITAELKQQNITNFVITPKQKANINRLQVADTTSLDSYITAYLDNFSEGYDKKQLLRIYRDEIAV